MTDAAATPTPTDRVLEALANHGYPAKRVGGRWVARCPHHPDDSPSLSVRESDTGNALVMCFAGCTTADVCREVGLTVGDLFPPRPPKIAAIGPYGRIKAVYDYTDERGALLFQKLRHEPKTFRQRRPNDNGSGWIWNTEGVRKVLYNLPAVRAAVASGRTIVLCEGEKDAENAQWVFDAAATTTPDGAGKWVAAYTEQLDGAAHVVVVADDDAVGHQHARVVAAALAGRVGRLDVLLPAEGHKDLTDHLSAGKAADELRRGDHLLEPSATEPAPPEAEVAEAEKVKDDVRLLGMILDWNSFWAQGHTEEEWLAYPLFPAGRQIALYAPGKTGKSLLTADIVAALATGRPVLGGKPGPPRRVLYLDYEMSDADLHERLTDLGYGADIDMSMLAYVQFPAIAPLDTALGGADVCRLAELVDAEVVVIDTLSRAVQGDENDADTIRNFYRFTGMALKAAGRGLIRIDHAGKDAEKGMRGSSAKVDDVDVVWRLTRADGGLRAERTHSRVRWVPERVDITIEQEPLLRHLVAPKTYPTGTRELAHILDGLGLALDVSRPKARQALKDAGHKARNETLAAALAWRRETSDRAGTGSGTGSADLARDWLGDSPGQDHVSPGWGHGTGAGTGGDRHARASGDKSPSLEGDSPPPPSPPADPRDWF